MDYRIINASQIDALWDLQKLYKAEIGENEPTSEEKARLAKAIDENRIHFYGAWEGNDLIGCCSVTVGFSTFDYMPSGVFEDFYIRSEYRHKGTARQLVQFAYRESGVSSLTVGCADCDIKMYQSLGFSIPLGNLLAFDE
ncbi:MAG: GNAT family N-acetyltransferase [Clostridia bacterium]|nr:GNAT family N-acetyltransferase [Clostridia bacterium]